jgi:hypothetical protein
MCLGSTTAFTLLVFLVVGQRALALDHSELALPVCGDAADFSEDAVVGQWFWPGGATAKVGISPATAVRVSAARRAATKTATVLGRRHISSSAIPHLRHGTLPCFCRDFRAYLNTHRGISRAGDNRFQSRTALRCFLARFFTHLVKVLSNHRQNLALSGSRESERRRPVCDGEAKGVVHNRCNHRQSSLTRVTFVI